MSLSLLRSLTLLLALLLATSGFLSALAADETRADAPSSPELLAMLSIPGDSLDRSGLNDILPGDIPHARLGGFSAIEHLGQNRYLLLSDRGPADGACNYRCRFHLAEITLDAQRRPQFQLLATTLLSDEQGEPLVGSLLAIDPARPDRGRRFDPEGLRRAPSGEIWLSDEYGPSIAAFNEQGKRTRRLELPRGFAVSRPSFIPGQEDALHSVGRQENRGFEGLALSPDGKRLYALLQGPLLQDHPRDDAGKRAGLNCRLLECDLERNAFRQFVYTLDHGAHGLNEILALNDSEFLVIERDGQSGAAAKRKAIYRIDLRGARDVADLPLPQSALPADQAVKKTLLIDLLDPRYGLAGERFPSKVEGLALGPDLPDGRRLLIICTDNDFEADQPSWFYFFAIP